MMSVVGEPTNSMSDPKNTKPVQYCRYQSKLNRIVPSMNLFIVLVTTGSQWYRGSTYILVYIVHFHGQICSDFNYYSI
jgi:hypothetical protein